MNSFLNLSLIYGLGFLFLRGISFLLLPVYTNLLSTFDAGIIFILYTILAFLNPVFAAGLDSALFKFYNLKQYSKENIISTSMIFLFMTSLFLSGLLILISQTTIVDFIDVPYNWLLYLSIVLFCDSISARSLVILRLKEKAWYYLFIGLINIVASLTFNILFISYYNLSNIGAVYALMLTSIVQVTVLIPIIVKLINFNKIDFLLYKKMLLFGLPFLPATILFITIGMIDRFFIESYLGLTHVGIYSAGYKVGSIISIIIIAFNLNWQPYYLKIQDDKNFSKNIATISQIFFTIILYIATFMCLFANDLIKIKLFGFHIIGESFWESAVIIPWVTFGYVFYGLYVLQSPSLYIKNKQNWTPLFWGLGTIINIILNIILIPWLGIIGAAISTFFSYVSMFVFIKIKNRLWLPLPIINSQILLYILCTLLTLLFRYYNQNALMISLAFIVYTIATIQLLNHIKKNQ
jgi:O-antigen/teichoic acid export membrane protein